MKNSPVIRVKDDEGNMMNINANRVVMFYEHNGKTVVEVSTGNDYTLRCSERSFRGYMNKALGVTKEEKINEE